MSEKGYKELHRPAGEFSNRREYLENELRIMSPRRWKLNLPKRDFNFEVEDIVPALSGTIGKIVMTTAIVAAYAAGFGLSADFVVENARFEILLACILFVIPFSGFLNPKVNLPGCHGPLVPIIGMIVLAGGHPLAIGLLMGVFGLLLAWFKGGSRLVRLTGTGVRGGLLIFLGMIGLIGQISNLTAWAGDLGLKYIFLIIIILTILTYALLSRMGKKWLAIPVCSILALVVALVLGAPFEFKTTPGIPNLNPLYWWGTDTGWMLGLPGISHFIASLPFALLAIAMWPPDFLGHRVFQEANYPEGSDRVLMNVDDTMKVCSLRQMTGSLLGGGNLASSWGTYLIPAGIAKRPIPAGAIILGVFLIIAVLLGFPMDLAIFPPVLAIALIVGVFLPLLEAGMQMIRTTKEAQSASFCVFASVILNPVFGWAFSMLLDNTGILGDTERAKSLKRRDRYIIPAITFVVCVGAMVVVGKIPGIPNLLFGLL